MADDNPFGSFSSMITGILGPSEKERLLSSQQGVDAANNKRMNDARTELSQAWQDAQGTSNGDPQIALKKFVQDPRFFSSPLHKSTQDMLKTVQEVTAPAPNTTLKEGDLVMGPNGDIVRQNPKPHTVAPGAGVFMPDARDPTNGGRIVTSQPGDPDKDPDLKARATHGATILQKVYEDANQAQLDRPRFAQLRDIVAKNPGGAGTWIRGYLADKGINVAGKSDLDLWSALINQAAPRTREPGSGVFTDKDFDAAVKGLPNMLKDQKANLELADQALAMIDYRIGRGGAAAGYLSGDKTRKQAFDEISKVPFAQRKQPKRLIFNPDTGALE